jgi:hypothetical protein
LACFVQVFRARMVRASVIVPERPPSRWPIGSRRGAALPALSLAPRPSLTAPGARQPRRLVPRCCEGDGGCCDRPYRGNPFFDRQVTHQHTNNQGDQHSNWHHYHRVRPLSAPRSPQAREGHGSCRLFTTASGARRPAQGRTEPDQGQERRAMHVSTAPTTGAATASGKVATARMTATHLMSGAAARTGMSFR